MGRPRARHPAELGAAAWRWSAHPNDWYRRTLLVARDGDEVVGMADLGGSTTDNLHLADLEINVRPERRRQGIGRSLDVEAAQRFGDEGRTSVCGEVYVPPGSERRGRGGVRRSPPPWASSRCTPRTTCCSNLPVPVRARSTGLRAKADAAAYDVLTWTGPCPDEHLEAVLRHAHADEHRRADRGHRLRAGRGRRRAAACRRAAGLPVLRRHHGGGAAAWPTACSAATRSCTCRTARTTSTRTTPSSCPSTAATGSAPSSSSRRSRSFSASRPERVAIHTDTAVDNHAMQATNRDFGFRPVERMHEMQRRDG